MHSAQSDIFRATKKVQLLSTLLLRILAENDRFARKIPPGGKQA